MKWKVLFWILAAVLLLPLVNLVIGIRPPTFETGDDPSRYGLQYEEVSFTTMDGVTLRGWFIPATPGTVDLHEEGQAAGCATILVGHGYPFDKANVLIHALFLRRRFNLLLFDFRYFGESDGGFTTVGLLERQDVEAAVAYLKQRADVGRGRIGALGFSMSAATFILAEHPDIQAIVADSPYAALESLIARQFAFFPGPTKWPFVALTKLYAFVFLGVSIGDAVPAESMKRLTTPTLIIHGDADSQIPVEHAREIQANANPETTQFWIVPGADHGLAHAFTGPEYEHRVTQFFDQHLCEELPIPESQVPEQPADPPAGTARSKT